VTAGTGEASAAGPAGTQKNPESRRAATVRDYLSLIRPANSIMVGFAVIVGIAVTTAGRDLLSLQSLLGFITGFSISSFSMITNDVYDYEVDKINQPKRAIPSGRISLRTAEWYSVPYLLAGLTAALLISPLNFAIAGVFALVGWFYNYRGKMYGLAGNSLVAASLAIPYIFGSIAVGNFGINLAYLLATTSFLAGLGREVLKGISDVAGDKIRGIGSVAISQGSRRAKQLTSLLFFAAVASSSLPVAANLLGRALFVYLILICIPDGIFVYLGIKTLGMKIDSDSLKLKQIALLGMMLGLLSYLIAGVLV
jgi:geranylgeranylglycerol-phosphate geranylgeranyltransferase